jgi:hypothetical protein
VKYPEKVRIFEVLQIPIPKHPILRVATEAREKWKKVGALEAAFEKNRPLGLWRQIVQELYDIKLKL